VLPHLLWYLEHLLRQVQVLLLLQVAVGLVVAVVVVPETS
jgi:hypothetical protein